jgi:hypothetical protein
MPSTAAEPQNTEMQRAELDAVLHSQLFVRSPALSHLLSYLCEKQFSGQSAQLKEYSIAVDVFGRRESFDQDNDSIVRVQANRLRKRLAEYYLGIGSAHPLHITIPVGQYVPAFEDHHEAAERQAGSTASAISVSRNWVAWLLLVLIAATTMILTAYFARQKQAPTSTTPTVAAEPATTELVGLPVGDEIRILAGSTRSYVDRSGKLWNPDFSYTGGTSEHSSVQHMWRTQDPTIYRNSRQGDFTYDIPLKRGVYELRLHFAETYYGPEDVGGGGEGSRVMSVTANGKALLTNFDVIADSEGARTAAVKVFTDITPAEDGDLHLRFTSEQGGRAMVSAIEILPGAHDRIRPIRIVARDVPYYSNDSHWWSADTYFKGGQLATSEETAVGTDDPELYETGRWGNFSYAIPVPPGKYALTLHFVERSLHSINHGELSEDSSHSSSRVFNVFCNGKVIIRNLNILEEVGANHPLTRRITNLEPNAQGKLVLDFVPVNHYATVSAIEVVAQ